ncbi:hypothetical protein ACIREO_17510 [Streptomyces sp. NPDC102441]|uniref:hypothetical protein n=1 Tax=Streptomyces sp. NPDC102441 TaxID=3366176 RepID=UPI0038094DB5
MGQRNHDEDADGWFGGDEPLDVAAADGRLALVPPSQAVGGSPFSWQCSRDPGDATPCTTDKPGSMDFPQDGELLCTCGAELVYRRRDARG